MTTDPILIALYIVVGGALGAFAGSLIHAVATRLPADLAPLGAPVCSSCGASFSRTGLIPLRRTHCANCATSLPRQKLLTEAVAAGIVILSLLLHGFTYWGISAALFSLVLLVILRIDWGHHLIYTATIGPGIVLAIGGAALHSSTMLLSAIVAAAAAGIVFALLFGLAILIYRQQALGFGDILLAVLIGAMTGVSRVFPAIFTGMVLAAAGGLLLIALGRRGRRDYIPYGAYLCAGTILVLLFR